MFLKLLLLDVSIAARRSTVLDTIAKLIDKKFVQRDFVGSLILPALCQIITEETSLAVRKQVGPSF